MYEARLSVVFWLFSPEKKVYRVESHGLGPVQIITPYLKKPQKIYNIANNRSVQKYLLSH